MKNKKNINSNNSLLKQQIDKFFNQEKKDTQALLYRISLLVYKFIVPETDVYDLLKNGIIDAETLDKIINYKDGELLITPNKKVWKECLLTTLCFYLRNIKNMEWSDIKKQMPLSDQDMSNSLTISLGKKNKFFSKRIKEEFQDIINNLDDKEIMRTFHGMWENK